MSNKKKKLLIVGPIPPPYSGPEIGTLHFLNSKIINDTYDVYHINTSLRASNSERGKFDYVMVKAYIKFLFQHIKALLFFRPDHVLYCIISASRVGWVRDGTTILLSRLIGVRVVMQFRGGHFRYFYDSLPAYQSKIIKWLLGRSRLVLAQADRLQPQFHGIIPESKIGTLYNSIPDDFYCAFAKKQQKIDDGINVLFVGHRSFAKGYCDLLEAFSEIAKQHNVSLSCIGAALEDERTVFCNQATGEAIKPHLKPSQYYQKYISYNNLEDKVHHLGDRVRGEDKISAFKKADIFVLPSYSEGFSMAILEGMSAGLPVIATCVGAAPEIIQDGDNGFIIAPGDIVALRDRLLELIENSDKRVAFGRKAREYCGNTFVGESGPVTLIKLLEDHKNAS